MLMPMQREVSLYAGLSQEYLFLMIVSFCFYDLPQILGSQELYSADCVSIGERKISRWVYLGSL